MRRLINRPENNWKMYKLNRRRVIQEINRKQRKSMEKMKSITF